MLEELQVIADSLAARLRRSVAIDDQQLRLLVHTPHKSETVDRHRVESIMQKVVGPAGVAWVLSHGIATAVAPVRIPPHEELNMITRICIPVRCRGILLAYLWLLDAEKSITDAELEQAVESANAAGHVLFQERLLGDLERRRDQELLRDLLASDATVRVHAARALVTSDRLPDGAQVAVLAVRIRCTDRAGPDTGSDTAIDLALQRSAHRLAPLRTIWTTRGGADAVLLLAGLRGPTTDWLREIGAELHTQIKAEVGECGSVHIGIGFAQAMAERQVDFPDPGATSDSWGLGWVRFDWGGHRLIGHDGGTIGQRAYLRILPDREFAVVLLTNGGDAAGLCREVFSETFGDLAGVAMPAALTPPAEPVTVDLDPYEGRYRRGSLVTEIVQRDGALELTSTSSGLITRLLPGPVSNRRTLVPLGASRFAVRAQGSSSWESVYFYTLPDGTRYFHQGSRANPRTPA